MIYKALAKLSDTPVYERGMRAFDVAFRTATGEEEHSGALTRGHQEIGQQIRTALFGQHPEATDYTFSEFDYPSFQARVITEAAYGVFEAQARYVDRSIDRVLLGS
jgi:hypothetical protein